MTVVQAVRTRLLAVSALTALIGTRIYALVLPQTFTAPAIRLQQIGVVEFMHLRGSARQMRARVQVDSVGLVSPGVDTYAAVHAVADAAHGDYAAGVATGLRGWRGSVGSPAFEITAILPDGEREMFDPDDLKQVKVSRDYLVWYLE